MTTSDLEKFLYCPILYSTTRKGSYYEYRHLIVEYLIRSLIEVIAYSDKFPRYKYVDRQWKDILEYHSRFDNTAGLSIEGKRVWKHLKQSERRNKLLGALTYFDIRENSHEFRGTVDFFFIDNELYVIPYFIVKGRKTTPENDPYVLMNLFAFIKKNTKFTVREFFVIYIDKDVYVKIERGEVNNKVINKGRKYVHEFTRFMTLAPFIPNVNNCEKCKIKKWCEYAE